ncbi:MAG: MBL fold metallo-hydrolase [Thermoguttaceae bacterium]
MIITPHRHNQIGGCITEIKNGSARICIDMGAELPGVERDGKARDEFGIAGITTGKRDCDAVFITHYHGDHVGLYNKVLSGIPVYIGAAAKEIFLAYATRTKRSPDDIARIENFKTFEEGKAVTVNDDITVMPFLVDHSAFDAYMFLVEGGGKRVLHTGDFRLHGFGEDKTLSTLENEIGEVDVLIVEGTTLSRPNSSKVMSEAELQVRAKQIVAENKYVFVLCASTNIPRIAAFYHAKLEGRKYFLCDEYQKGILDFVKEYTNGKNSRYNFEKVHTYGDNLLERFHKQGCCMLIRPGGGFTQAIEKIIGGQSGNKVKFVYSMWEGYKNDEVKYPAIVAMTKKYDFESLHTSGHATPEAIRMVCDAVKPKKILPIHGENVTKNVRELGLPYDVLSVKDGDAIEI